MALFPFLLLLARSFFTPRLELMAEILALRQQLAILNRTAKRPSLRFQDRLFWVTLAKCWQDWRSALLIVKPETVIKWHRQGFRLYWRWKSKTGRPGRPRIDAEIRNLSTGSHERILYGARHGFKPNSTFLGSKLLNRPSPSTESNRLSLHPKPGRLSSPIMPRTSSASTSSQSPLRRFVTFTASSSFCMKDVESFIST